MRLLALDSATEACSAALLHDGQVIERHEVIGRGHAERLLPMVDELLAETALKLQALDAIAFGRGPGAFTGLRIAAGLTQGLAAGAGLAVLPVSDLAAIALAGARASGTHRILACMDARMGEIYWAAFDCSSGLPVAISAEAVADPARIDLPGDGPWFGAGRGFLAYPVLARRLGSKLSGVAQELLPRAADIARIGARDLGAGRSVDAARAIPVYLRNEVVHRR